MEGYGENVVLIAIGRGPPSLAAEAPLNAPIVAADAADVLVEPVLQDRLPRHELEPKPVLDHGEAPAGEVGDARQSADHILAQPGRGVGQATLGRHLFTDAFGGH